MEELKNTNETLEKKSTQKGKTAKQEKEVSKNEIKPLIDTDEIEVISLIPNISYKDSRTGDMYEWNTVGHSEFMPFDVIKNMWRNNKGYFKNMWLKPVDDRVINKFGLTKTFEKYEFLMNENNYTKNNINKICKSISETPNGLKKSIYGKVKNLVVSGGISDVTVIRALEKQLNVDLISFLK